MSGKETTKEVEDGPLPSEHVLEDSYPIYGDYLYVVDGKVYRSDWHGITARQLKAKLGATEIRNCDIFGRQARKAGQ
jgi:hypothetical protein